MTFTALSFALILLLALSVSIGALRGYKRGLFLSATVPGVLMISVLAASIISIYSGDGIGELITDYLDRSGTLDRTYDDLPRLLTIVRILGSMIGSSLIFLPIFLIIYPIVGAITQKIIRSKTERNESDMGYVSENASYAARNDKKLGALIGGICGFIIAVIISSPIVGTLRAADAALDVASDVAGYNIATELNDDALSVLDCTDDAVGSALYVCGGKLVFGLTAKARYEGETISLYKELNTLSNVDFDAFTDLIKSISSLRDSDINELEEYCNIIEGSPICRLFVADIISNASRSWLAGGKYMGIAHPSFGKSDYIDDFFDEILDVCRYTNQDNVADDLRSLFGAANIIADFKWTDVDTNYEIYFGSSSSSFKSRINALLTKNARMPKFIDGTDADNGNGSVEDEPGTGISSLAELSVLILEHHSKYSTYSVLLEEIAQSYNLIASLSYSYKELRVASIFENSLRRYGIEISDELSSALTKEFMSRFGGSSSTINATELDSFIRDLQ